MSDIKPKAAILQALHMLYTTYRMAEVDSDRLSHETGLPRQTLTGTLNIMVSQKEVARTEHKIGTKRMYRYSITTKGREALAKTIAPSTTAEGTAPAPDKPGVSESETTPEAAIAQGPSLPGEGAARQENPLPTEAAASADAGKGDGLQARVAELEQKVSDAQNALLAHTGELGVIDFIVSEYVPEREAQGVESVKIMARAIDAHMNTIQTMANEADWMRARIEELETNLRIAENILNMPETAALEAHEGPFVVAGIWHEAGTAEEAENIARDVARTMRHGQAVVARPISRANLTVRFEDFGYVPPAQLAAAA